MRIRVDEIPESGRKLHLHRDQEWLGELMPPEDPFEIALVRPVNADLEIDKRTDHIRITGNIRGTLQVACHRCLKPFLWPLNETVDVYLVEEPQEAEEDEVALEPEELEYEFFDGETIDVDLLVAEQIFLALPYKVLCSEDCRGLCPRCGANLNDEACQCEVVSKSSPFSRLEKLKDQLPASGKARERMD